MMNDTHRNQPTILTGGNACHRSVKAQGLKPWAFLIT